MNIENLNSIADELLIKVDAQLIFDIETLVLKFFKKSSKTHINDFVIDHLIGNDIRCYELNKNEIEYLRNKLFLLILETKAI